MSLDHKPLSPLIGVEVLGINPRNPSQSEKNALRYLFETHHAVLIRDENLTEDEHIQLVEAIAPVSQTDLEKAKKGKLTHISNAHQDGRLPEGELLYHADHMFRDVSLKAISLYALEVPHEGGETRFLSSARAYETLPTEIRHKISSLSARHVYDYTPNRGDRPPDLAELSDNSDMAIHPLVCHHPGTGAPILLVSKLFTVEVLGLAERDSKGLLEFLFKHIESLGDDYVHSWTPGDLLIWDNQILQHARNLFPKEQRRSLRRVPAGEAGHWR
jgi:taurine dioxygenase